jgi:hypothetical protein
MAKQKNTAALGLDPQVEATEKLEEIRARPEESVADACKRTGQDFEAQPKPRAGARPVCPVHGSQMVAYSTMDMYTYYRCAEQNCGCRDKLVRAVGPLRDKYGHGKSAKRE